MLETIKSPDDLKKLSYTDLTALAGEVRSEIINTVSRNGGHLASNLGVIEATIALHRVFNSPDDKIIFDVGHQCYAHKLLTGRYERFGTLRQAGGLSGFTNKNESPHDIFNEGHCGTSISTALGIATAAHMNGSGSYTVAVVGDGAFTNGMIYEAMNNCGKKDLRLIIVLNDNEMSISKNIGGLHSYLSKIRTSERYFELKHNVQRTFQHIPLIGKWLIAASKKIKNVLKRFLLKETIFENLGIEYLGPVDGNDIRKVAVVLEEAKSKNTCCLVHITTKKGFGYPFAEMEPDKYHAVGPFDISQGAIPDDEKTFSLTAGEIICKHAESDNKICAITAAMCDGTGLSGFAERFPRQFFDVGIAEEHAITFAAGLSSGGMKPVCVLYSTFAQRVYDQALHDIAIQRLPMILALDRCGLVPGDGITHQGIFDYALFSSIPEVEIYSPETFAELSETFDHALRNGKFDIIRYPKGAEQVYQTKHRQIAHETYTCSENIMSADIAIITYGRITSNAQSAVSLLSDKFSIGLIKLIRIHPIDFDGLRKLTANAKLIYILEEGIMDGGVGERLAAFLRTKTDVRICIHAITSFISHGALGDLYRSEGFLPEQIADRISKLMNESAQA